jgi:hypothetical protein
MEATGRHTRMLIATIVVAAIALLAPGVSYREAEAASALPPVAHLEAPEQAQPACPAAIGSVPVSPNFQIRGGNLASSQSLTCNYVGGPEAPGHLRLLLRWNDPATTVSAQCHSRTNIREQSTTSNGNDLVKLWSPTNQTEVQAVIVRPGTGVGIGAAEAVAAAWLAEAEQFALPCAPDPEPIVAGSLACPPRIGDLVWLGFFSSGDIGVPKERQQGGETIPGFQLNCDYRAIYADEDVRGGVLVIWVEPSADPPRSEDCRNFGQDRWAYSASSAARAAVRRSGEVRLRRV